MTPKLYTPEEAAAILKRPVATLKRWRSEGEGPTYVKIGKSVRYKEDDLVAYIDRHTHRNSVLDSHGDERWT